MSDETRPGRAEDHGGELSPLDEALLATSRMRMISEETSAMSAGMTEDVFGNAELASMIQQFTRDLGATTRQIADRMDRDLGSVAESDKSPHEDGRSDHG